MNNKDGRSSNSLYRDWLKIIRNHELPSSIKDFWSFEAYITANLGAKPKGQIIGVIKEELGYVPGNMEWINSRFGPRPGKYETRTPHKCKAKGVVFDKANMSKPYKAQIVINYKNKHLGYFDTEEDAAKAYDIAARNIGRKTNFSE